MRRLRAGLVTPSPGGLGPPSAPNTRGRLHWLDAARTKAGESLPDRGAQQGLVRARKLRPRGQKSRQISPDCASLSGWSAERRPHLPQEGAARRIPAAPNGAPPPRFFEGNKKGPAHGAGTTAYPAPVKNTGAGAWLFDNWIEEYGLRHTFGVMPGLDPGIHDESQQ